MYYFQFFILIMVMSLGNQFNYLILKFFFRLQQICLKLKNPLHPGGHQVPQMHLLHHPPRHQHHPMPTPYQLTILVRIAQWNLTIQNQWKPIKNQITENSLKRPKDFTNVTFVGNNFSIRWVLCVIGYLISEIRIKLLKDFFSEKLWCSHVSIT